jgi:hypothetical protein
MDYPLIKLWLLQKEVNSYLLEQHSERGPNYFYIPHISIHIHAVNHFKHCNLYRDRFFCCVNH